MDNKNNNGSKRTKIILIAALILLILAIVVPKTLQFNDYAKEAEAMRVLKAIYGAKKNCFDQKGTYVNCGFGEYEIPQIRRYTYWSGQAGSNPFESTMPTGMNHCTTLPKLAPSPFESQNDFLALAAGQVDRDPDCDIWTINAKGELQHHLDDIAEANK